MAAEDDSRGFFSQHDSGGTQPPLRVSTADSPQHAAIRPARRPVACMRFEDFHFEFDSSFLKSIASTELTLLAQWHDQLGHPALGVFGHADPVGSDDYNKTLSGRRAQAMYALLVRRTDLWDQLWSTPFGGDNWQNVDSARAAHAQGFAAYMDSICRDGTGKPWQVDKSEFIAKGRDPQGKGDYQGCGEFNPVLRFSSDDEAALAAPARKDERDRRNASNRRVLVFLWPPGTTVDPAGWPCPRVGEGVAGCRAQFWPDGDARRNPTAQQREYSKDHDTFACRWYDGMARGSPCEAARKILTIRLFDIDEKEMPNAQYRLTIGTVEVRNNSADGRGILTEKNVLAAQKVKLEWGAVQSNLSSPSSQSSSGDPASDSTFEYQNDLHLDFSRGGGDEPNGKRLVNLGYGGDDVDASMKSFRKDYDIPDATSDEQAKRHLQDIHDNQLSKADFKAKNGLG